MLGVTIPWHLVLIVREPETNLTVCRFVKGVAGICTIVIVVSATVYRVVSTCLCVLGTDV